MELAKMPEIRMWREVILRAVLDAQTNNIANQSGTEKIYQWTRSADCKEVCYLAQLDHDAIRIGFIKIYLEFLENQLELTERELLKREVIIFEEIEEQLAPIKEKIKGVHTRWEKIKWRKM